MKELSPLEIELQMVKAQADVMSNHEAEQLVAAARIVRTLSCFNSGEQIRHNEAGAIIIPGALLKQTCTALGQDNLGRAVFCFLFQEVLWEDIKKLNLDAAYLYHDKKQIILRFLDMPIGEFKLPFLDLAIPITSSAIWYQLTEVGINYITLGMFERDIADPRKMVCLELHEQPKCIKPLR